ncbi:MAG: HD domain-containing protein [Proteobacteria bacterium]|nr:HD domain-containing protein [Pseudomonadota bacterium]
MLNKTNLSLKASIQRKLIIRLSLVCVCISILLALIVYYTVRNDIGDATIYRTAEGTRLFNSQAASIFNAEGPLDRQKLQEEVDAYVSQKKVGMREGKFVFAGIYDTSGNMLTSVIDKDFTGIEPIKVFMELTSHRLTFVEDVWFEVIRFKGKPFVRTAAPLKNRNAKTVAHLEGIFALSPQVISNVRQRILRSTILGIAIVIITSALLYPIIINLLGRLTKLTINLLDSNLETLQVLGSAIAKRDSDTDAHNYRVTIFSVRLAEAAGLARQAIQKLIKGAFLHDVGKIGVRDNILLKPGRLDEEEFEIMKTHVQHGLDIVSRSDWLQDTIDVVGYHHEKFNGEGGYGGHKPGAENLQGEDIPINARIFAIADVFDALTSKRPYKEPFSFEESIDILKEGSGSHFDPDLLEKFISIAKPLYGRLSGHDDDVPKNDLGKIIEEYFAKGAASLIQ